MEQQEQEDQDDHLCVCGTCRNPSRVALNVRHWQHSHSDVLIW